MEKQKVLIISYFFYPCNFPGAHRTFSWAKYLNEFGLYPIVITRNWEGPIKNRTDLFVPMGNSMIHKKEENYEIYYLPYKGGLRDRIITRYGENSMVPLRKTLTYLELIAQNFTSRFIPYRNFYAFAKQLIKSDPAIRIMIASAMPFGLFRICHYLNQKTGIPWIADYRDDWNTTSWTSTYSAQSHITGKKSFPDYVLSFFERKSEKRWVSSASLITTVSKYYVNKISNYVLLPARVIYNGFDVNTNRSTDNVARKFTISYIGNLYWKQPIDLFFTGVSLAMKKLHTNDIEVNFVGTGYDLQQKQRLEEYTAKKNLKVNITDWMSEDEVYEMIQSSHLLLSISYQGVKGVIPSKVFNYLAFYKPVLLCPSDHDELEETLINSGLGMIANDAETCCKKIAEAYHYFVSGRQFLAPNKSFVDGLSRKSQTEKLASIILHTISTS